MKIITEIAGSAENRIVYEDSRGRRAVYVCPGIYPLDLMRRQLEDEVRAAGQRKSAAGGRAKNRVTARGKGSASETAAEDPPRAETPPKEPRDE